MAHRENILVVDDEPSIVRLITLLLRDEGYGCATAESARDARGRLGREQFELVLCDVGLRGESGIELVRHLRGEYPDLAVVMVTGVDDPELARAALQIGAYGYVVKPFTANVLLIAVANALQRRRLEVENRRHRERLEEVVLERTLELHRAIERLRESEAALQRSRAETIRRLAMAVEFRDGETGEHIERMSALCGRLATCAGLDPERCELIRAASPLHDIGKIAIPDRILLNPQPLANDDWELMRRHAELGFRMLAGSGEGLLDLAATIAWTHHERIDGSGYPRGLKGQEIPIEGRIAAVADTFDALTSGRVYQVALPVEEALAIMRAGRGTLFDPDVFDALLAILAEDAGLVDSESPAR